MRIHEEKNGIAKEAIVLQWAARITSCDFKPAKKRWAGTLLSGCFVQKTIVKESCKFELTRLKKKKKKKKKKTKTKSQTSRYVFVIVYRHTRWKCRSVV